MRPLLLLLSILAGCASPSSSAPFQAQPAAPAPARALAGSTIPDLVQDDEPPLVAAVRNGTDGRLLIMGLWGDGRMVWSADPVFGGRPYFEVKLHGERLYGVLHSFRRLFARWTGSALEYHPEGASHVELICTVGGADRRLASWHESFETNSELAMSQLGVLRLGGRSRDDVLAGASPDYRRFRILWDDIRRLMRTLEVGNPSVPSDVTVALPPPR